MKKINPSIILNTFQNNTIQKILTNIVRKQKLKTGLSILAIAVFLLIGNVGFSQTAPAFSNACPGLSAISFNAGDGPVTFTDANISSLLAVFAFDPDGTSPITYSASPSSVDCTDSGILITVTATDVDGSTDCVINVLITSPSPTFMCNDITVYLDGTGNYTLTQADLDASSAGSVAGCGEILESVGPTTYNTTNIGIPNQLFVGLQDEAGNAQFFCNINVTVLQGANPPSITCPANNLNLPPGCNPTVPAADVSLPVVMGGFGTVTVTHEGDAIADVGCTRTVTRTYRATDDNGDFAECSQTFTFTVDTDGPVLSFLPQDFTADCGVNIPTALLSATDGCGSNPSVSFNEVDNADPCNGGTITRTWSSTDACNNNTSYTQTITVNPAPPTTITCPADMTVECFADILVDPNDAIVSTSCSLGSNTVIAGPIQNGQTDCSGTTYTYTYTVTDDCGRSVSCDQIFTIQNQGPILTCPADQVVTCFEDIDADPTNLIVQTSCGLGYTAYVKQPLITGGIPGCDGTVYTYIYKAVDDCGRVAECEQQFLIQNNAPTVTVIPGTSVECFDDIVVSESDATVSTDCAGDYTFNILPVVVNGPANCPGTTYTYTYRVKDFCNRIVEATRVFTLNNDSYEPVITSITPTQYVDCFLGINPSEDYITYDVSCGVDATVNITGPVSIGQFNCPGSINRYTYTVTDVCGRTSASVTFDYIIDNEGPIIDCPETLQVFNCEDGDNEALISAWIASVTASASCGNSVSLNNNYNGNAGMCINNGLTNVTFTAVDACGRTSSCVGSILMVDTEAPIIYESPQEVLVPCSGVTQDIFDAWLSNQGGAQAIDGCWGDAISWSMSPANPTLNCDGGPQAIVVEFIATDGCGNSASTTGVFNTKVHPQTISVSGLIMTEEAEAVADVEVGVEGGNAGMPDMEYTNVTGGYGLPEFDFEDNLAIVPTKTVAPLNGLSTYDLILLQQHILDVQSLDSPYKRIAADINRNGSISTLDLIHLRRLILFIDEGFQNNTSWRFVEADFVFPNPDNPFETAFPETHLLEGIEEELADFIAIKIGDLNLDAELNEFSGDASDRNLESLVFQVEDKQLSAEEAYSMDFTVQNFEQIHGFQFTINFDNTALDILDLSKADLVGFDNKNFSLHKKEEGIVTVSWNHDAFVDLNADDVVFSLMIQAKNKIQLSEILSISSQYTKAEAYQSSGFMNVALVFGKEGVTNTEKAKLFQNVPNPFSGESVIGFNLPEASFASLTIYDITGQTLKTIEGNFVAGYNEVLLSKSTFNTKGVFYYQLKTTNETLTKSMLLID